MMEHRYVSRIGKIWDAFGKVRAAKRWARHAFAEFEVSTGRREEMLSSIVIDALNLTRLADKLVAGGDESRRCFVDELLQACQRVDSGDVRHSTAKLRSYVDISVQAKAVRAFADYLSSRKAFAGDSLNVTALLLEERPDSRPALLAHAELLIERQRLDEAITVIHRALRIQAVCPSAQQLLSRAYNAQRGQGSRAGDLDGTNYDLSDKFCPMPFTHLATGYKGDAFVCCCPAWVPFAAGNVLDAPSADAVWNSDVAAEIRRSVHDGDFSYCSRTLCSYIAAQKLPLKAEITDPLLRRYIDERSVVLDEVPQMVQLNHDPSCNLACPSCRTEVVTAKAEEQDIYAESARRVILPFLRKMNGQSYISGGGEVFASKHYRSILSALNRKEYPELYLYLITNGQLITAERWQQFPDLPEMIDILSVSIDAARAETYERLRRPGKWPVLMTNLELIAEMRRAGTIRRFQINFVVQDENYRELPAFVELGIRLGVDSIWLQRLTNYGSYVEDEFAKADVTSPAHINHGELLDILRSPIMSHPSIDMEMLLPLLPEAVASDMRLPLLQTASRRKAQELRWGVIDDQRNEASISS
ncbi:MAG TPA: radical SAM protein [Pyrinomonadaceae bacterium]|jgi:tetratricopeptide (TPR) repeat protein